MSIHTHNRYTCYLIAFILLFNVGFTFRTAEKDDLLVYDITFNDKKIGFLEVRRRMANELWHYSFISRVHYNLPIKNLDIRFDIESTFSDNHLIRSSSNERINNEIRSSCLVNKSESGYRIVSDKNTYLLDSSHISYSLTMLYYNKPERNRHVFSERYGRYLPLHRVNEDKYMLILPGGSKNFYTYSGGICKIVDAAVPFGKLQFKLQ